jgi:aminopeptidase N
LRRPFRSEAQMTSVLENQRDILTQDEAIARAARVSRCQYQLAIDLTRDSDTYRGEATIRNALSGREDVFLDYRGKTILLLEVNNTKVETPAWTGYRLTLPGELLRPENTVYVSYENDYDHEGDGFHQFKDPEDGEEYLYSNFEPYEAHRLFPCFDQPDIKAAYELTVTAPPEWEVIANARLATEATASDGRRRHKFERTKPFSSYLFALIAGPYGAVKTVHRGVELGLYCRKSLMKHLDSDEIFAVSKQGLDFYGEFFDYPYPFGKYDQIFVPEFNAGAMENVGAITHNEYMVFRDPPTDNQRRNRAETILHEMAHMWFGDLVTMRWWNDLWLNESFATYMAYLCLDNATRFENGWQAFNAGMKNWAYRQDQLVTTHPIAGQVADTDATFLNFDGITYGKGASVLKQLVAAIGMDGFREGMRYYFQTYAFGNATLEQFLGALEDGSGRDLQDWSKAWLETASLNTIGSRWESDGDRITSFTVTQSAPDDYPTLRPHRRDVGLLRDDGGRFSVTVLPLDIDGAEAELPGAQGLPRPSLVFPNYNDHGYAKVALDPESLAFGRTNMERGDDTLLRQLLWSSLWNMVRDQQLKSTDFLTLVREKLPLEPAPEIVDAVLGNASAALARYVPEERRENEYHLTFLTNWSAMHNAPAGDAQIIWARAVIATAIVPADIERVARLVDGEEVIAGLTMDQDMRWTVALKFVGHGMAGAEARVAAEVERDPSDRGQRAQVRAQTSVPSATVKAEAWERINGDGYGSLYMTNAAIGGFTWTHQRDLLAEYVPRFFEALPEIFRTKDREFASDYVHGLFPGYRVEEDILERSRAVLAQYAEELPVLERMLREANDDLARSIRCRQFAAS